MEKMIGIDYVYVADWPLWLDLNNLVQAPRDMTVAGTPDLSHPRSFSARPHPRCRIYGLAALMGGRRRPDRP